MLGDAPTLGPRQRKWRALLISILFILVAPVAALAPKGTVVLVGAGALIVLATGPWRQIPAGLRRLGPFGWALVLLLGWASASLVWTIRPDGAASLWLRQALVALGGGLLLTGIWTSPAPLAERWRHALAIAAPLLLALLLFELWFDGALTRLVRPGQVFHESMLSRGSVLLAIFAWPAAAAIAERRGGVVAAIFLVLVLGALYSSPIAAATLAFLLGAALFVVVLLGAAAVLRVLAWLLPLGVLAFALLFVLVDAGAYLWEAYPDLHYSLRHRLLVWQFVGERIAEHPMLGWGFDASRDLPGAASPQYGPQFGGVLPLHPHNAALQLWLELGLPGLLLGMAVLGLALRAAPLLSAPRLPQAAAVGAAASFVALAQASFGIWQSWWLASAWLAAAMIATTLAPRPPD